MASDLRKYGRDFLRWVDRGLVEHTDEGMLLGGAVMAKGMYRVFSAEGDLLEEKSNVVPTEGLNYFITTGLLGGPPVAQWYLALFSGAVTPDATWTAATFPATASEITSNTEGYSNPTRVLWTPATTITQPIATNINNLAAFNIVSASAVTITGAALLSSAAKGSTTGVLVSATRFNQPYAMNNGSTYLLGYEVQLLDV